MLEHPSLLLSVPKSAEEDKADLKKNKNNKHLKAKTMTKHNKLNYF